MKFVILAMFGSALLATSVWAQKKPHYDLQMSSQEYTRELQNRSAWRSLVAGPLDPVLASGQRNLQWLDYMNSFRTVATKIHLTKPGDLVGIPIETPVKYSEASVLADYQKIQVDMPTELSKVLYQGASFPKDPPVDVDVYIKWARKMDRIYQYGARWILLQPYVGWLADNKALDVRGTYFLEKNPNLQQELNSWDQLALDKQSQYKDWLNQLCLNSKGLGAGCDTEVSQAEKAHGLYAFFQSYQDAGKEMWKGFFRIPNQRNDVKWNNNPAAVMKVPFITPDSDKILSFLRDNIEAEWQTPSWNLRLDFHQATEPGIDPAFTPHLEFKPGVTPHVNGIAGNIITMDQNAPIDEWDVRWIIRHEFGHVLGFLDCYLEIYDANNQEITAYQMDVTNLMCSRQGKFQQQHFDLLQKTYAQ